MRLAELHFIPWRAFLALLAAYLVLCSLATMGQEPHQTPPLTQLDDEGVFDIFLAGRAIGNETFRIRTSSGKVEARAEIRLELAKQGKTVNVQTYPVLILDPELRPVTYTWKQKGHQSSGLEADFRGMRTLVRYTTVGGAEDNRDFELPQDVMVLDDNVFHHYELVAARYQAAGAGKQSFPVFVPQEALRSFLTVEDLGMTASTPAGDTANLRRLLITTDVTHVDLWVDSQQHLQRVSVPGAQLDAVRKK